MIPVRDGAAFVTAAIESALDSIGVCVEVIVVDDESTDGTCAVVDALIDARPHAAVAFFRRSRRGGAAGARNDALAVARAPFIFTLDADNTVFPHGLLTLIGALEREPSAAFAYGYAATHDGERFVGLINTEGWDPALFRSGNCIDASALFRASLLRSLGGYDESFIRGWEDFELWLRCAAAGRTGVHTRSIVYRYLLRPGSRSAQSPRHAPATLSLLAERYGNLICFAATGGGIGS